MHSIAGMDAGISTLHLAYRELDELGDTRQPARHNGGGWLASCQSRPNPKPQNVKSPSPVCARGDAVELRNERPETYMIEGTIEGAWHWPSTILAPGESRAQERSRQALHPGLGTTTSVLSAAAYASARTRGLSQALRKPSRAPVRGKKRRAEDSDSLHEKRAECVFFSSVVIVPSTAGWLLGLSSRVAALYAWCPRSKSRSRSRADWPVDARHARIPPNRPQSVGARFTHRPILANSDSRRASS
ncbi:hypothetical protein PYCCODRAFT_1426759 [Trametes coccinea BRFM310]|uniref:Uncharacterized protein n=1 Tax=Trametes coccinea (strain BRFM310) TaxID=1353009 RepID=A0A1Y2IIR7_TRAC3|nr:hypothetical protein PYCCODRAFT_1426759 [Trametes coccinea BRFM310]